jgi:hypothetical protein
LVGDTECLDALCVLVGDIINGHLYGPARTYLTASLLIPTSKPSGGIRPIAVSEVFYKLACLYGMELVHDALPVIFEPIQLGVGAKGGADRALHVIQAGLELFEGDAVLLKCDFQNAFNERDRGQILSELFQHQSLRPLWRLSHWAYHLPSDLFIFDQGKFCGSLQSAQGVKQGDGLGSLLFSLSVHKFYQQCSRDCSAVHTVAIADDLHISGPAPQVLRAFDNLINDIKGSGLRIRHAKCGLLWPSSRPIPHEVIESATAHNLTFSVGSMETLGAPVGSDMKFVEHWLSATFPSQVRFCELLLRPEMSAQVANLLLRLSMIPSMGYLARVIRPSVLEPHAEAFDALMLQTCIAKFGLPNLLSNAAQQQLFLPIRLGGFGLRSLRSTSPAAYWSALALSASHILSSFPAVSWRSRLLSPGTDQVPFASELDKCYEAIVVSLPSIDSKILPVQSQGFWQLYGHAAPPGLQRAICAIIENAAAKTLQDTFKSPDIQRLVSCQQKHAGAWLLVHPSSPDLVLSDGDFSSAVRHRLGLPPADDLPKACICGTVLSDPGHFHSCPRLMPRAITTRHDHIVNLLARFFKRAGALVRVEAKVMGQSRIRPDLEIILPDQTLLVDIAVAHPAAPSRKSTRPLATARIIENAKSTKYAGVASARGGKFLAFIFETYGAYGRQALDILKSLQSLMSRLSLASPPMARSSIIETLSIALQRGNALVSHTGALAARTLSH